MSKLTADFPKGQTVADLSQVPGNITHLAITPRTRSLERLAELPELTHIWLGAADSAALNRVVRVPTLEYLVVGGPVSNLPLEMNLPRLRKLALVRLSALTSLEPLRSLTELHSLAVLNGKVLLDYSPISALTQLESLEIGADQPAEKLTINSVEWISSLTHLRDLTFAFYKVMDGSIRAIGNLSTLQELTLPGNTFAREDFAYIAGRLPQIKIPRLAGFVEIDLCKKCGQKPRVLMTGKGVGILCLQCDEVRFKELQTTYEAAVQAARNSVSPENKP